MGNLLWFWLMLFCHSPCTELPTYRGLSRMLLKLPVSIALDLGTPSALQPTQSLTTFWGRLSRSEFSPNLWCCGRWTCWMVTSRLVSGGKQESGATVGVNWRCSGEPSGLGGDGGTGGRRLWLPRARIRAGCQELGSGPGQRRQEWAQAPHRFCWDIHSGLSSPFWACNWIKDRFFCAEQSRGGYSGDDSVPDEQQFRTILTGYLHILLKPSTFFDSSISKLIYLEYNTICKQIRALTNLSLNCSIGILTGTTSHLLLEYSGEGWGCLEGNHSV